MKRRWVIMAITSVVLIGAGILVRTERKDRQLAKRAAAYRIRAEQGDAKAQWALGAMYYYGKEFARIMRRPRTGTSKRQSREMSPDNAPSLQCISMGRAFRRTRPRAHAGAEELRNKGTLKLSTA